MYSRISVYPERCTGCRMCMMACSLKKMGAIGLSAARIWVAHFGEESRYVPVVCMQCADAPCQNVCPARAISRDDATGALSVDPALCIGCRMCAVVCPFGAMGYSDATGKAAKCDDCGGNPTCVRFCPVDALQYGISDDQSADRRHQTAVSLSAGASVKP